MAQQPTFYNDGTWTTGIQVGANLVKYPFENYSAPDVYARNTFLSWRILPAGYSPLMAARTGYTNGILQSEALTTTWTATNLTVTAAGRANPFDGQVTMFKCLEAVTNGEHYISQNWAFNADSYTFSFFVAGGLSRDYQYLKVFDGTTNHTCFFNTTTGTVGTASNATGAIQLQTDGSYRISITATCASGSGYVRLQSAFDSSTISYAGDITKGLYAWGAQLQESPTVGPYIPTTITGRTISAPDWQPTVDPFAYLVNESDFTLDQIQRASFQRVYSRIPKNQTSYPGSIYIPLPSPVNQFNGASTLIALSLQYNRPLGSGAYQGNTLYTSLDNGLYRGKVVESAVAGEATGGTFTITYRASTSGALNWNDSNATIAAAINAIGTVVSDGITVSAGNELSSGGRLALTMVLTSIPSGWPYPFTMNAGSLTVTTSKNPVTSITSGNSQFIYLPDHLTITGHGFNTGVPLAAANYSNRLVVMAVGYWGSIDANTIWLPAAQVSSQSIWAIAGDFIRVYPAGNTVLLRSTTIEEFSLPGVTSGITTPSDITSPIGLQATDAFLNALVTTSGFQTYRSEGPLPWMDSLIYTVKRVQINLSDVT